MKRLLLLLLGLVFVCALSSCKAERVYIKTPFEGKWIDISPATYLGGERYDFFIARSDSFYLCKYVYTDVFSACHPIPDWHEYYSGTFTFDKDSIHVSGAMTDSVNNQLEMSECIRNTILQSVYKYEFRGDTLVLFSRPYDSQEKLSEDVKKKHEYLFAVYLKKEKQLK